MARMTDEERERRASLRARRTAQAAEADDRRVEERRLQWQREGVYMTRAEIEAGEPCRGCGQPLLDGLGDWGPLNNLTPDQRAEYDRAEGTKPRGTAPGLPVAPLQPGRSPGPPLRVLLPDAAPVGRASRPGRADPVLVRTRPEDLDDWDGVLTCGNTVRRTQHRDHGERLSWRVTERAACGQHRGVITAQRIGRAGDPFGQAVRDRRGAELAQAQAKLDKQRKGHGGSGTQRRRTHREAGRS